MYEQRQVTPSTYNPRMMMLTEYLLVELLRRCSAIRDKCRSCEVSVECCVKWDEYVEQSSTGSQRPQVAAIAFGWLWTNALLILLREGVDGTTLPSV